MMVIFLPSYMFVIYGALMCTFTPLTGQISDKSSRGLDNSHGLDNLWIGQVANSEFVNITYGMIIFFLQILHQTFFAS